MVNFILYYLPSYDLNLLLGVRNGSGFILCNCTCSGTEGMSSLKEICNGLPVHPLPPSQPRDTSVPHAPVRNITKLTGEEKQVQGL